jgi:hypothetical protein
MKTILLRSAMILVAVLLAVTGRAGSAPPAVDFRYQPGDWRSMICMPADPVKTLVWKNGVLGNVDDIRLIPLPAAGTRWVHQELLSPRVPIVLTRKRAGPLEIVEEAFVSPIAADAARVRWPFLQRMGHKATVRDSASPTVPCEEAFRHAATGRKEIVHYRFPAEKDHVYTVVFGFCEGSSKPGDRLLDIEIEAKHRRRLDLAGQFGRNVPVLIPLEARDENGDGMIDLAVAPDNDCRNPYSLLSVLWVFEGKPALDLEQLLRGRSNTAPLAHVVCGDNGGAGNGDRLLRSPSVNVALVRLHNTGDSAVETAPEFVVEGPHATKLDNGDLAIGPWTVTGSEPFAGVKVEHGKATLQFPREPLGPSRERVVAVSLWRLANAGETPRTAAEALALRDRAAKYWNQLDLPYDRLQVPDQGIQSIIEASLRSIYQNRDYKNGVPVYQVGPTCYRDISCADGAFLCELGMLLGRPKDAADTLDHLLSFQCANGRIWVYWDYWKESGLVLWSVVRYAELTGDAAWLESRWRRVEGMVAFIQELRRRSKQRPAALNYGLIPDGFGDGGTDVCAEYSNVLWDLVGLRAAVAGAKLLGKDEQAAAWQREVEDMEGYFRTAARRDARKDKHGNFYLPNVMGSDGRIPPPRGQWAFVQSIYPGKLYHRDDPLAQGGLAMLEAAQVEGLPLDAGWMNGGVWPYFSHWLGNAWLWTGQGQKSPPILYDIANHASPLLAWWEEQMPQGKGNQLGGDMPHNWGSAEFIRQVRYMLVLERGKELHLFEGLPAAWTRSGMVTRMNGMVTEFGPLSFVLAVSADGRRSLLELTVPQRIRPGRVVLHLDGWSARSGTIDLPTEGRVRRQIELK